MEFFVEIIKEEDFVDIASDASANMLAFETYFSNKKTKTLSKKIYVALTKEAMELEEFLDDHGARNNKKWIFFGEIVASIRNYASTGYIINHILRRITFYKLSGSHVSSFINEAQKRLAFLDESIISLFKHLKKEAQKLGVKNIPIKLKEQDYEDNIATKILPQNLNDEGVQDVQENVLRVAAAFLKAVEDSEGIFIEKKIPMKDIDSGIIPDKINEETIRHLESYVHNAQSMYDTYVQKTTLESENPVFSRIRGYISITLHLLGTAKELSHFFERHEASIRLETTKKKIDKIISRKKVLDTIINFAIYYYSIFAKDGKSIAKDIIEKFTAVDKVKLKVPEGLGFHLRPSTLVAKIVNHYGSPVYMIAADKQFDAGSVIDLMWAGGMIKKQGLSHVYFTGEKHAIRDIKILAGVNYGEDNIGNSLPLPKELSYLRKD